MTLSEGQLLQGRYQIEQSVARGGYGAVYRAFDTTLNRICAVKENLALGPQAESRFAQEAQLLARLHHPNMPRVIDHFLVPERGQYLVMDYVEGRNLQEILRHRLRPLGQDEALAIIYQVCAVLSYLHNQSPPIVHRDVKPQNIIVTPSGPAMLVDFGTSKVVYEEAGPGAETLMGLRGITPGFAAPEQYGMAPTDARCDVYSTGATLYALLTGHAPVDALLRLTDKLALPPIRQFNGAVSPAIEQVVLKALEPSVTQRLPSIDLLLEELHAAQASAPRDNRPRSQWSIVLAVAGAALVVVLAAGMLRLLRENPGAPAPSGLAGVSAASATATLHATPTALVAATQGAAQIVMPPAGSNLPTAPTSTAPTSTALPPTALTNPTAPSAPQAVVPAFPTPFGGGGDIIYDAGQDGSRDIYRMGPDGSHVVDLTSDATDDWIGSLLSSDGRFLLYSSKRDGNWDIYAQDLEQGQVLRLTDDPAEDHDPAWSPTGERILFHSNRGDGIWRIYSMQASGSDLRLLTHDPRGSWAGAWSPDGSKIAFSANYPQPGDIYVMNADGSNAINLTNSPAHESAAHWAPDGAHIAFYSDRDGNREIYMMDADGSNPIRLTDNPAIDITPNWSPDGKHIVFASDRQGNMDLYMLELATGAVKQLTNGPLAEGSPTWAPY